MDRDSDEPYRYFIQKWRSRGYKDAQHPRTVAPKNYTVLYEDKMMKKYIGKSFKDVEIGQEFWDYTQESCGYDGDLFIKTSLEEAIHKNGKFIVKWKEEDLIEVEK